MLDHCSAVTYLDLSNVKRSRACLNTYQKSVTLEYLLDICLADANMGAPDRSAAGRRPCSPASWCPSCLLPDSSTFYIQVRGARQMWMKISCPRGAQAGKVVHGPAIFNMGCHSCSSFLIFSFFHQVCPHFLANGLHPPNLLVSHQARPIDKRQRTARPLPRRTSSLGADRHSHGNRLLKKTPSTSLLQVQETKVLERQKL